MDGIDPSAVAVWHTARSFLPFDLDTLAQETGALARRRGVTDGEGLVRTLLCYALPNSSLKQAARLARRANLAQVSSVALFKRLRSSEKLLQSCVQHLLTHAAGPEERFRKYRVLAVDATVLCGPGARGTDQRLHVVYDLGKGLPISVEVTDVHGGEKLSRHKSFGTGDLVLGDRGYAQCKGIVETLKRRARILVRFEFSLMRVNRASGRQWKRKDVEPRVPETGAIEIPVYLPGYDKPLRAIGERNLQGEVVWLLTNLKSSELPRGQARELYMRRWQIELFFKRLKSLLDLDELPSRDGPVARPWIWAKLILASLAVLVGHERFSPWGRAFGQSETQQVEGFRSRTRPARRGTDLSKTAQTQTRKAQGKKQTKKATQATLPLEEALCALS
jgi:hypothetical protein